MQLDFFVDLPEETKSNEEISSLQNEIRSLRLENRMLQARIEAVEESTGKVRRGVFAKHSDLAKKYLDLHYRYEILERNLCKGSING